MRSTTLISVLFVAIACRQQGHGDVGGPDSPGGDTRRETRTQRIDYLGSSCKPDDWGTVLLMAAGKFDWPDRNGKQDSAPLERATRCAALRFIEGAGTSLPLDNAIVLRRLEQVLDRPPYRDVVLQMLDDKEQWCPSDDHDPKGSLSPRYAMLLLVSSVPFHSLRKELQAVAAERHDPACTSMSCNFVASAALQILDDVDSYHPSSRARRIDEMVADGTPQAFGNLLDLLDADHRWDDGAPQPKGDELDEITAHEVEALRWLNKRTLSTHQFLADCGTSLSTAIRQGDLGAKIVAHLDNYRKPIREQLLTLLLDNPRDGSADRLVWVQRNAGDPDIVRLAEQAEAALKKPPPAALPPPGPL